jgi:crossover junction endodeoxyribonuclease RusA
MRDVLKFTVVGVARPKGSAKAFLPKGWTRPIITSDNKSLKGWEDSVRAALQQHAAGSFFQGPVSVKVTFELPKPKKPKSPQHVTRPDLDKLVRGSLDAMKGVLWNDDSQVIDIQAGKRYAETQPQAHFEIAGEMA